MTKVTERVTMPRNYSALAPGLEKCIQCLHSFVLLYFFPRYSTIYERFYMQLKDKLCYVCVCVAWKN